MFRAVELKNPKNALFLLALLAPLLGICQYTDVINSNRPGLSVSAYAVGKGVPQLELGFSYEKRDHADLKLLSLIGKALTKTRISLTIPLDLMNREPIFQETGLGSNIWSLILIKIRKGINQTYIAGRLITNFSLKI